MLNSQKVLKITHLRNMINLQGKIVNQPQRCISQALRLERCIRTYVLSQLRDGQVTMWASSTNPSFQVAEQILEREKVPYQAIEIDKLRGEDQQQVKNALQEFTHSKVQPSVFIGSEYIGHFEELQKKIKNGELKKLLMRSCF